MNSPLARAVGALAAAALCALPASADRVTVKGATLEGTVLSVDAKSVEMKTVYGSGKLVLKMKDVTSIETDGVFHVYHDDQVTSGRVLSVAGDTLTVGDAAGAGTAVALGKVQAVQNDRPGDGDFFDRLTLSLPYWTGNFDLAFNYTDATVDSTSFATGFALRRQKAPSRLLLQASYARASTQNEGEDETLLTNELRGLARYEYDLAARLFGYGSLDVEHDGIERLSFRGVPKAGLGYRVWERPEQAYFSVDGGLAWVYERFFGGDTNDYLGLALGAEAYYKLSVGAEWRLRLDYTPSLTDWTTDYLLRTETSFTFPLNEHLGVKTSLIDLYDSTPAEDTQRNTLQLLVGASVLF